VPVRIADLTDTGLSLELFVVGIDAPVATFGYHRVDVTAIERSLIETEERSRQMQQSATLQFASVSTDFQRRLARQQERLDSFVEYPSSLLFDNLASRTLSSGSLDPNTPSDPAARSRFQRLLRLSDERAPGNDIALAQPMTWVEVASTSDGFVFGWYDLENDKAGRFRWMGPVAILLNPSRADPLLASKSPSAKYMEHLSPRLAASSTGGRSRRHSKYLTENERKIANHLSSPPRKRGSRTRDRTSGPWIPAFAGMTDSVWTSHRNFRSGS
jgi:hypothetical protein